MLNRYQMVAVLFLVVGAGFASCLYCQLFGAGRTPERTAQILVHDFKFGMRAKTKAIKDGDAILPLIKLESNNFQDLNGRNAFWIADVLGSVRTELSRSMLNDLYSRTNRLEKLTGAVGLAEQGILPEEINENSFLVETVRHDKGQADTQLAIIALGQTKNKNALPCLLDLLKRQPIDYWHHVYACEAVARIRAPEAIPVLRDCLKSSQFHAIAEAFRALICLGDREAIPLAIARVTPGIKGYGGELIVKELTKVTGQSYGYDQVKWKSWWESAHARWNIPAEFNQPWDEQEKMD